MQLRLDIIGPIASMRFAWTVLTGRFYQRVFFLNPPQGGYP